MRQVSSIEQLRSSGWVIIGKQPCGKPFAFEEKVLADAANHPAVQEFVRDIETIDAALERFLVDRERVLCLPAGVYGIVLQASSLEEADRLLRAERAKKSVEFH